MPYVIATLMFQLEQQVELMIDQEEIRQQLVKRDLVAFVANGAILPRKVVFQISYE